MGAFLLGYVVYTRLDTVIQEWVDVLEIWQVYLGLYVLILAAIVVIVAPFLSCFAVYQEIIQLLQAVSIENPNENKSIFKQFYVFIFYAERTVSVEINIWKINPE